MTKKMYLLFTISQCSAGVIDSSSYRAPNAELRLLYFYFKECHGIMVPMGIEGSPGKD